MQHFGIVSQFKTVHRLQSVESYTPSAMSSRRCSLMQCVRTYIVTYAKEVPNIELKGRFEQKSGFEFWISVFETSLLVGQAAL